MKNNGKSRAQKAAKERKPYTEKGYFIGARIWLGGDMARYPTAFMLYIHLVGWANHADGEFRRGQVPLGAFDMGVRLGLGILTVRKWLRWLSEHGWIALEKTSHGRERGTVVTVLQFDASQDFATYDKTSSEDQKMILTPEQSEDQKMILKRLSEDQILILNPPSEDQIMIPQYPITHSYSGAAQRHRGKPSQGGEAGTRECGLGPSAESIAVKARETVDALVTAAAARAALERGKRPVGTGGRARTVPKLDGDGPKPLEGAAPPGL